MAIVSIIVPVYNVEKYLAQCLDSLIMQTLKNIEIILIDDGSTDNSGLICDEYAAKDKRFLVIHQKNKGVSAARNSGIQVASSKWITFIDSDDWIEPDMLEKAIDLAEKYNVDILQWNHYNNWPQKEKKQKPIQPETIICDGKEINRFQLALLNPNGDSDVSGAAIRGVWAKLYKSSLIKTNDLVFSEGNNQCEDLVFNLTAFEHAKRIMLVNQYWYHYRMVASSLNHSNDPKRFQSYESGLSVIQDILKDLKKYSYFEQSYYCLACEFFSNLIMQNVFRKNNSHSISTQFSELKLLIATEPYHTALSKIDIGLLNWKHRLVVIFVRKKLLGGIWFLCKLKQLCQ
jgi:glycosyltransferase involved in cell wall biosynthesis